MKGRFTGLLEEPPTLGAEWRATPPPRERRFGGAIPARMDIRSRVGSLGKWTLRLLPVAVAAGALPALTALYVQSVGLYLNPDGAHYLADADALVGTGVTELRHAPLFPSLVAATRLAAPDAVTAVQLALGLALAGLQLALYVMARRWTSPWAALLVSGLAAMSPIVGELMGWQGGATLVGVAALALAIAAVEAWVTGHPWGGVLTGAALGVTALAHPFVLGVAIWCVTLRWVVHVSGRRRPSLGWDPLGLRGIAAALTIFSILLWATWPVYQRLQGGGGFSLRPPTLESVTEMLEWATGGGLPAVVLGVAVAAALGFRSPGPLSVIAAVGTLVVLIGAALEASSEYTSRIAYVLPAAVAAGLAAAAEMARSPLHELVSRLVRPRMTAGILVVALVGGLAFGGYGPRVERAASYYQWLQSSDIAALQRLGRRAGAVATSWKGNDYGSGVGTSWYVEGLARRKAYGPTAPSQSMIPEQVTIGADTQQLFAGAEGLQNGTLQIATGPPGIRADPAIAVRSSGMYHPMIFGNALVNQYPVPLSTHPARRSSGRRLSVVHRDDGDEVLRQELELHGRRVEMTYRLADSSKRGDWDLYLWPAYGFPWTEATAVGSETVAATVDLPDETVALTVTAPGAEVSAVDGDARYGLPAIRVRARDVDTVSVAVDVRATARPTVVKRFDQQAILRRHAITDVLLLKDTGWRARFDQDSCYRLDEETASVLVYRVAQECNGSERRT